MTRGPALYFSRFSSLGSALWKGSTDSINVAEAKADIHYNLSMTTVFEPGNRSLLHCIRSASIWIAYWKCALANSVGPTPLTACKPSSSQANWAAPYAHRPFNAWLGMICCSFGCGHKVTWGSKVNWFFTPGPAWVLPFSDGKLANHLPLRI